MTRRGWILIACVLAACNGSGDGDTGDGTETTTSTGPTGTDTTSPTSSDSDTQGTSAGTSAGTTGATDSTGTGTTASDACEDPGTWLDRPAHEQIAALQAGQLCCVDLRAAYLQRITDIDESGDAINSILALDDASEAAATTLDGGGATGDLHCAVIVVKDNIDAEGMVTTAGSLAMVDNLVDTDAPAVAGLRAAGALILGKANLSEWANFRGQGSSSGWSSFGGQTRNGADPSRNPCGSSSGSGAAVAAGLVSAAVGTETSGSVVCPSSVNGVVGMKPTLGLVSRTGIVPIAHSHDTAGPMAKTVLDAALLLGAMAGPDAADPATDDIPADFDYDFATQLASADLSGKKLGYSSTFVAQFSSEEQSLFDQQITKLEGAGATVVQIQLPNTGSLNSPFITVLTTELKADLNAYLAAHAGPGVPADLQALIDFNNANAAEVMPHFGQEWFIQAQGTNGLNDPGYINARDTVKQGAGPNGLLPVLENNELDAIVLPTTGPAWITNYQTGDQGSPSAAFLPAAAGYPHLTVPMGLVSGLPVGISFIGRPWDDGAILALGHAYEQL